MSADKEIMAICERTFQKPRPDGSIPRQFHDKTHACLHGELRIDEPEEPFLRHGLFAKSGCYPALVRLSSSFFYDDRRPDGRGMAIKLKDVVGEVVEGAPAGQQDFVLIDQPNSSFRNEEEALSLFNALDGIDKLTPSKLITPKYVMPGLKPWRIRWHYLKFMFSTAMRHLTNNNLAHFTYYSVTPYSLGEGAVKYQCRPDAQTLQIKVTGSDFRTRLQNVLNDGAIGFDFYLQPRIHEKDPIDDAGVIWKSPAFRVGHLKIPSQKIAPTIELGNKLTFSPWNCLAAHEPLGSINALRRSVYQASAKNRGASAVFPAQMSDTNKA